MSLLFAEDEETTPPAVNLDGIDTVQVVDAKVAEVKSIIEAELDDGIPID